MWPFTVYHASERSRRRYTLFAASEALREKWRRALEDALAVRGVQQESNMVRPSSLLPFGGRDIEKRLIWVGAVVRATHGS